VGACILAAAPDRGDFRKGLLRVDDSADGLADAIAVCTRVQVFVTACDLERGLVELSMKEP